MNQKRKFATEKAIKNPTQFISIADINPTEISWDKVVETITTNSRIAATTQLAREYLAQNNRQQYTHYKAQCGAFTPASFCEGGHASTNIKHLTGIVMVDLDHLPNASAVETALNTIKSDPHTFIAYVTCSGLGIRILAPFTASEPTVSYLDAWRWVNEYYQMATGYDYDRATKDASRLSYFCHDAHCYYNPEAKKFFIDNSPQPIVDGTTPQQSPYEQAEQILSRQGMHFVEGQRHHYLINAAFLLNKMGIDKQEVIDHYTALHDNPSEVQNAIAWVYDHATLDHATWHVPTSATATEKANTNATSKSSNQSSQSKRASIKDIRQWLQNNIQLRYNVISGNIEYYNQDKWIMANDFVVNSLWEDANIGLGRYVPTYDFHNVLRSTHTQTYNPFKEYLDSLPEWNEGDTDYLEQLMSHVHTESDDLFRKYFPKWLVGMIASWLSSKVTNQMILAFIGPQGVFKSTFFRRLLPPELDDYFLVKTNSGYLTKDDKIATGRYALIAFEEIDALRSADVNAIKALVTTETIDERAPYARNRERLEHVASFCATGNNSEFLTDLTGNRRWLPFQIITIDSPYENPINYEGLYAQIYHLYKQKFHYWNTQHDDQRLEQHLKQFRAPIIEEEIVEHFFEIPDGKKITKFLSATEIKNHCESSCHVNLNLQRLSQVMKNLGFEQHKRHGIRGYLVVERTFDEMRTRSIDNATEIMKEQHSKKSE